MKLHESLAQNHPFACRRKRKRQEAVKIGVDLLVAADVVEPRYYQQSSTASRSTAPIL